MKKISVIIPVYNAEKWIKETLNSLVSQTYKSLEIICVDDGSKDQSCEIIREYQKEFDNIVLINQKNSGVCAARNRGIEESSGEYIAFLDADDIAQESMYEEMVAKLEEEKADIVFCEFVRFWSDGHKQFTIEESFPELINNPKNIKLFLYSTESRVDGEYLYTKDIHGACWRSVYKKEVIVRNNVHFHTDLRFAEDQIFVLEYLEHCKKISFIDKPFVWYRGWTKKPGYRNFYTNHINLAKYQEQIIKRNTYYSEKEKKQLTGYLKCSAYFMIVIDEFRYAENPVEHMNEYVKNKEFNNLFTLYNFIQKYKARPEPKRIALFFLLKLRTWKVITRFLPPKKYN